MTRGQVSQWLTAKYFPRFKKLSDWFIIINSSSSVTNLRIRAILIIEFLQISNFSWIMTGDTAQGPGQGPQRVVTLLTPPSSIMCHTSHTVSRIITEISRHYPHRNNECLLVSEKNALIVNFVFRVKNLKLFPQSAGKIIASDGFWRIAKKITSER